MFLHSCILYGMVLAGIQGDLMCVIEPCGIKLCDKIFPGPSKTYDSELLMCMSHLEDPLYGRQLQKMSWISNFWRLKCYGGKPRDHCPVFNRKGLKDNNHRFVTACREGEMYTVQQLVSRQKVDINRKGREGKTPVMIAALYGQRVVFDYLVAQYCCNLTVRDALGDSVLHVASAGGNRWIVRTLIEKLKLDMNIRGQFARTPLLTAALKGKSEICSYLLSKGCDREAKNVFGENALHHACRGGDLDTVKILHKGYPLNGRTKEKTTPAMLAMASDSVNVFRYLVQKGSDLWAVDGTNKTVLHIACQYDSLNCTKYLIQSTGFPTEGRDDEGRTPFLVAVLNNSSKVVKYLMPQNLNHYAVDAQGNGAIHLTVAHGDGAIISLLLRGIGGLIDINRRGMLNRTALAQAVVAGKVDSVKNLLLNKASKMVPDNDGNNVLHLAVIHDTFSELQKRVDLLNGMDIDAPGIKGRTAMMLAAQYGRQKAFITFYQRGARLDEEDWEKNTPFHMACIGGNRNIVKLLIEQKQYHNRKNTLGQTPQQLAKKSVRDECS